MTLRKFDAGKVRPHLLPIGPLKVVLRVLEFGAQKYGEGNWLALKTEDDIVRYKDALARHVLEILDGQVVDPESGLPHLAHAAVNCLFLLHFSQQQQQQQEGQEQ